MSASSIAASSPAGATTRLLTANSAATLATSSMALTVAASAAAWPTPSHVANIAASDTLSALRRFGAVGSVTVCHQHGGCEQPRLRAARYGGQAAGDHGIRSRPTSVHRSPVRRKYAATGCDQAGWSGWNARTSTEM